MRKHETDVTSLVFGLVFLGIAGLWALVQYDVLSLPDASTAAPVVLVVAGLIGVLATVRRSGRARRTVATLQAQSAGYGGTAPAVTSGTTPNVASDAADTTGAPDTTGEQSTVGATTARLEPSYDPDEDRR